MKRFSAYWFFGALLMFFGVVWVAGVACASPKSVDPSTKMSLEHVYKLQIDALQLDRIQRAAQEAARPFLADREETLKLYGLTSDMLASGEVQVDADGKITRKQKPAPDMGAPAKKGK